MDVNNEIMNCDSIIDSFLDFYGNLNRAGWVIQMLENGWQFVNVSFLETYDGILSIPWPAQSQIPGRWNTSTTSPRSPSPAPSRSRSSSPISLASTEEFVPRSGSGESVSSSESDSLPQSSARWYTMPTTPPPSSPSPPPEKKIPDLLFRQAPPKLADCKGCEICDNEEIFPNAMWICGHMVCQSCVFNIEESGLEVRCPFCRESGQYYVGRMRK